MAMPSRTVTSTTASEPTPYRLTRVEKEKVPADSNGQTWYRYVLHNGNSTITGRRCGTLETVTDYANHYAKQLNARAASGYSPWTPRSRRRTS